MTPSRHAEKSMIRLRQARRRSPAAIVTLQLFLLVHLAGAAITFPVSIKDTAGGNDAYYDRVRACVQAAGAEWARYLTGSGSIEVEVEITLSAYGVDGQSLATGFVRRSG